MGKQWKYWLTFWSGGSKITADGDCSHEIQRHLLLGRKVMTNLDSIVKSRDITLPTKVLLVKAMVFPVVMYECESWTVKKSEVQTIDAFELWCWRRLLRVPWTARWLHQSNLKEISPDIHWKDDAEAPILWPPDSKNWLIGKDLEPGKDWRQEKKEMTEDEMAGWHHRLDRHEFEQTPGVLQSMGSQRVRHNWSTELNWSLQSERLPFPGGPVAKYPHSQCRGPEFDPSSGN